MTVQEGDGVIYKVGIARCGHLSVYVLRRNAPEVIQEWMWNVGIDEHNMCHRCQHYTHDHSSWKRL